MFSFLRPFIAPAIMPFLGAALAYLATRFGIVYSPEQQTQITEGAVSRCPPDPNSGRSMLRRARRPAPATKPT